MYTTKEEIEDRIKEIDERIEELENGDDDDGYKEMIDSCYGTFKIGCCEFDASRILEELDPIAYRCGYNDYIDAELTDLENEKEELEQELEELEEDESNGN